MGCASRLVETNITLLIKESAFLALIPAVLLAPLKTAAKSVRKEKLSFLESAKIPVPVDGLQTLIILASIVMTKIVMFVKLLILPSAPNAKVDTFFNLILPVTLHVLLHTTTI
jgi:hypothetical protein